MSGTENQRRYRLGIAADHAGFALKERLCAVLRARGYDVRDYGCGSAAAVDYPDYAALVANGLRCGDCDFGVLICGSGIGMSIAANRCENVRAALCEDVSAAETARLHNDANILVLGARRVSASAACDIAERFLGTAFSDEARHIRRLEKLRT